MSLLQSALRETLSHAPERLEELSALVEHAWIEQALAASGRGSIRRRKLPAEHAVWLVIGLALFRKLVKNRLHKFPTKKMPVSVN